MTQDLLERTVLDWVSSNPGRGARDLRRLACQPELRRQSPQDIAEALIELAGRLHIAETRAW